jgi:hypothetical protein
VSYAQQRGIVRRVQTDDHVEAVGTPQTLAV